MTAPLFTLLSGVRARMPGLGRSDSDCRGVVLMFHEIFGNDKDYMQAFKAGCTTAFLEAVIVELRRARWDIVHSMKPWGVSQRTELLIVLRY